MLVLQDSNGMRGMSGQDSYESFIQDQIQGLASCGVVSSKETGTHPPPPPVTLAGNNAVVDSLRRAADQAHSKFGRPAQLIMVILPMKGAAPILYNGSGFVIVVSNLLH